MWTKWSGLERGEGKETVIGRHELLPTPRVSDETAVTRNPYAQGVWPDGTLRVDQISAGAYTADNLKGLVIPDDHPEMRGTCGACGAVSPTCGHLVGGTRIAPTSKQPIDFFFELVEDGRGANPPAHTRFRLYGEPDRAEGSLSYAVNIQRASEDFDRLGDSQADDDDTFAVE